jgi:thiamine-monophosphate kinase
MARWASHWDAPLVGGDIAVAEAGSPLVLTCTVAGNPHPRRGPVLRSGARPSDVVWVTGRLGGSLASGRHLSFEPRVREGLWLCETLGDRLHAMIDLSDGLGRDAGRIAAASGVRIELELPRLPLHPGMTDPLRGLSDGEDYELCFAAAEDAQLPALIPEIGTALTSIGRVVAGEGCIAINPDGGIVNAAESGWDHGTD